MGATYLTSDRRYTTESAIPRDTKDKGVCVRRPQFLAKGVRGAIRTASPATMFFRSFVQARGRRFTVKLRLSVSLSLVSRVA